MTEMILRSTYETLLMVAASTFFSTALGVPVGILLYVFSPESSLKPKPFIYILLSRAVNILRSFPFIILIILLFPLSRLIIGKSIGTAATIVPLSIAASPFVAKLSENAFKDVDKGVITAAKAMGSSNFEIIFKVLLPESLPALVDAVTLTVINLIGYSAMAGAVGGGGLGDLAIRYGYQMFMPEVMAICVLIIIVMVELIQSAGSALSGSLYKRR